MSVTDSLTRFVTETTFEEIPTDVREHASVAIRDFLGVAIAGTRKPVGDRITEYVQATSADGPAKTMSWSWTSRVS